MRERELVSPARGRELPPPRGTAPPSPPRDRGAPLPPAGREPPRPAPLVVERELVPGRELVPDRAPVPSADREPSLPVRPPPLLLAGRALRRAGAESPPARPVPAEPAPDRPPRPRLPSPDPDVRPPPPERPAEPPSRRPRPFPATRQPPQPNRPCVNVRLPTPSEHVLRAATSTVAALSTKMSGGVLLSHAVPHAVPSALKGLTSGFGMGPGVSPSPWPPKLYGDVRSCSFARTCHPGLKGRPHLGNRTVDACTLLVPRGRPLGPAEK